MSNLTQTLDRIGCEPSLRFADPRLLATLLADSTGRSGPLTVTAAGETFGAAEKLYCALFPARDDEPDGEQQPEPDREPDAPADGDSPPKQS